MGQWDDKVKEWRSVGYTQDDIDQEEQRRRREYFQKGFSVKQIGDYFGDIEFDKTGVLKNFNDNIQTMRRLASEEAGDGGKIKEKTWGEYLAGAWDAVDTGWQTGVVSLLRHAPTKQLPQDADMFYRIASQIGQLAGDLPAMTAGFYGGGAAGAAAGSAVPVIGNAIGGVVGAGGGSFALPAAMRKYLMESYEKGDVKDFRDFWSRASAAMIEGGKSFAIGGATAGAGGLVGSVVAEPLAAAARGRVLSTGAAEGLTTTAKIGTEIATMTTLGAALEGEAPSKESFLEAAILVGGLHAAGKGSKLPSTIMKLYEKFNIKPEEVALGSEEKPVLKQELNAEKPDVDKAAALYKGETPPEPPKEVTEIQKSDAVSKEEIKLLEEPKEPPPSEAPPTANGEPPKKDDLSTILEMRGEKAPKKSLRYRFSDFYRDFVDKLDPIKQTILAVAEDPKLILKGLNPYNLARMVNDYQAKVKKFLNFNTTEFGDISTGERAGENNGIGYRQVVQMAVDKGGTWDGLDGFLMAKRALEIEKSGRQSGFTPEQLEASERYIADHEHIYGDAAKEMVGFQNRVLKYLLDAKVISNDQFERMVKAGESYVPFMRILDDLVEGGGTQSNPLKKLKGSDKAIQSPLISIQENTARAIRLAEINRAKLSLVDFVLKNPDQELMDVAPKVTKKITISAEKMAELTGNPNAEALEMFKAENKVALADNEIDVVRDGVREIYSFKDKHVAQALNGLGGDVTSQNIFLKLASAVTTIKKLGITFTPEFIIKNPIRDQFTKGLFSMKGSMPFGGILTAMGDIIGEKEAYRNFLSSGGAGGSFLELEDIYLKPDSVKLQSETGYLDTAFNIVKHPLHYMELAGKLMETATRLSEFKSASEGAASGPKLLKAGFSAREVTVDFNRIGAKMSALNAITAFQNVNIQGLDRTLRAIKDNPMQVATRGAAYLTVPSILLWWANKDDERYKEIPQWQKDSFWIIPTDNWQKIKDDKELEGLPQHLIRPSGNSFEVNRGVVYRLPKPQEMGLLFASLPERLMEKFFTSNPRAMEGFGKALGKLVTPTFVPDAVAPFAEQFYNKNFFTEAPLIPYSQEKILPQYQYTDYTSETAKVLGKLIAKAPSVGQTSAASPLIIENYIKSWGGTLGGYALQLADVALTKAGVVKDLKPESTLSDIPFVKAFVVRYPTSNAQSLIDFRERYAESEQMLNTLDTLKKRGDPQEYLYVMQLHEDKMLQMRSTKESINNMSHLIQMIYQNPDMSKSDKRQLIDGYYYLMIQFAKSGLETFDQMDRQFKEIKK